MADNPYAKVKLGRLKLKSESKKRKKKEKKKAKREAALKLLDEHNSDMVRDDCAQNKIVYKETPEFIEDQEAHAGWWYIRKASELHEECAIEFILNEFCYISALDDGTFTLSGRKLAEDPDRQEIFVPIPINDNHFAFKTGFGRYIGVDPHGKIIATAEAYGP